MADIKKLKSVGICTVKGIQMTTRRALCNVKGLSEAKVDKIKEAAGKLLVIWCDPLNFISIKNMLYGLQISIIIMCLVCLKNPYRYVDFKQLLITVWKGNKSSTSQLEVWSLSKKQI